MAIVVGVVVAVVVPITIAAVLLLGGGGVSVSLATPEDTITSVVNAFNAFNADALYSCLSAEIQSEVPIDNLRAAMQLIQTMDAEVTGLQISNVNISDDTATATASGTLTYTYEGQTTTQNYSENYQLVREGGLWKINNFVLF